MTDAEKVRFDLENRVCAAENLAKMGHLNRGYDPLRKLIGEIVLLEFVDAESPIKIEQRQLTLLLDRLKSAIATQVSNEKLERLVAKGGAIQ